MTSWVVFTDLDETLLDRETYSFDAALPALEALRQRAIPLVLCTSKTAAETRRIQELLRIQDPFVVEDGGGIGIPKGYFRRLEDPSEDRGDYLLVPLAARRSQVLEGMKRLKTMAGDALRSFSEMSVEEIMGETLLPPELAPLARDRQFDEPFLLTDRGETLLAGLNRAAEELGLRVTRGGRFYHLHGETDKGRAVTRLKRLFEDKSGRIRTLGLGDSPLDLQLLAAVDLPIAVQRRDGTHDPALVKGVPGLRCVPAIGPAAWNAGVLQALMSD